MKHTTLIFTLLISIQLTAQSKSPVDFGFRHFRISHGSDTVDILVKSKKGEEHVPKPVLLFCQGSLPIPLIVYDEKGVYGVFPFQTDSLTKDFHLAIVGKPSVPLMLDARVLNEDMTYSDPETGKFPKGYSRRNFLDHYVQRDAASIRFLQRQDFVSKEKLVVAGHSEGSTVAAKLALTCKAVTHLIYAGGNPLGRIQSIIQQSRGRETDTDSARYAEMDFEYWEDVVSFRERLDDSHGDTYKATYDFSIPPIKYLERLRIPVFVCYGTRDRSMPFNDYFRAEMIRQKKKNFTFKAFIGLEHNFFGFKKDGQLDPDAFHWDDVAAEWLRWLRVH